MASLEKQYVEVRIGVSEEDQEALAAKEMRAKDLAAVIAANTVEFCEAQQSVTEDSDGSCGVGSLTAEDESGLQVGFFCQKPVCNDQTICREFATPQLLSQINSQTQYYRPFRG